MIRYLICFISLLCKLISIPVRRAIGMLELLVWPLSELTRERSRWRQMNNAFQRREPLSDFNFLEQCAVSEEDRPIWLTTRRAVADCCRLPEVSIYPSDKLSDLRYMMIPKPGARWYELGPNWYEVVMRIQEMLGVNIPYDEFEIPGEEAELRGELITLRQFTALLAQVIRVYRDGGLNNRIQ